MRDAWLVYVALAAAFVLVGGLLAGAWVRGRLGTAAALLFALALAVWVVDIAAISSGYRDADGFFDCRDACTGVHFSTAVGFLAPPLLISLAALGGLVAVGQRRRGRRGR